MKIILKITLVENHNTLGSSGFFEEEPWEPEDRSQPLLL